MSETLPRDVGSYRLEKRLGQGGMGVVYRAVDLVLERPVAVKMLRLQHNDDDGMVLSELMERFLREAKAAARIQSRHVAQVLTFTKSDEGELAIVMELLEGITLGKLLAREHRLAAPRAVAIARQICRGMQAAHDLGIVHRDLKPANVMIVKSEGVDEFAKILDFGVAKLTSEETRGLTQTGAVVGTISYMAPEQLLSKPVDARSDIYALGVILYRMLAGVALYDGESLSEIVHNQVSTQAPPLRLRAPDALVPPAIEAVVLRCLEKDPARRFPSMAALDDALGQALLGIEPVQSEALAQRLAQSAAEAARSPVFTDTLRRRDGGGGGADRSSVWSSRPASNPVHPDPAATVNDDDSSEDGPADQTQATAVADVFAQGDDSVVDPAAATADLVRPARASAAAAAPTVAHVVAAPAAPAKDTLDDDDDENGDLHGATPSTSARLNVAAKVRQSGVTRLPAPEPSAPLAVAKPPGRPLLLVAAALLVVAVIGVGAFLGARKPVEPPPIGTAPVVTEPAPVVTGPAPVVTEPAPVVTEPAPVVTEEAPVVTDPAPVVTAPAKPEAAKPAPKATTQKTTPAPKPAKPKATTTNPKTTATPKTPKQKPEAGDAPPAFIRVHTKEDG